MKALFRLILLRCFILISRKEYHMSVLVKKLFFATLTILLTCGIASCKSNFPNGEEDLQISVNTDAGTLVLAENIDESYVNSIKSAYLKSYGKEITVLKSSTGGSGGILVGKIDCELSQKAYRHLKLIEKNEGEVAYLIYSDGQSIAIAFDDPKLGVHSALIAAIECFVDKFIVEKSVMLKHGVLHYEAFNDIEWQAARDEAMVNLLWEIKNDHLHDKLVDNPTLSNQIINSLKNLKAIYGDPQKTVAWLANLYDPETGGFYFSNSARNNLGYLPDLESTAQALGIVESILIGYEGTLIDFFGEDITSKFVSFAKDMQASDNGYFYHPQWSRELTDEQSLRRERDLLNALEILDSFGALPKYDTPNGRLGEMDVVSVSALTYPLNRSMTLSVSKMVSSIVSNDIFVPGYLRSKADFEAYLSGLDILGNTSKVCDTLISQMEQIVAVDKQLGESGADYSLSEICAQWLNENQNKANALWQKRGVEITSESVRNAQKIVKIYNRLNINIPRPSLLIKTIVDYTKTIDGNFEDISEMSDVWILLSSVATNLNNNTYEGSTVIHSLYVNIPYLLDFTLNNLAQFSKSDGSFSSARTASPSESHGMPIALGNCDEGDINATIVATKNLWLSIFNVLGMGSVPLFSTSERMVFHETLLDMGVIIKNEIVFADPIDFEGDDVGSESSDVNSTFVSGGLAVVDSSKDGNVLKVSSPLTTAGDDKISISVQSSTKNALCSVLEFDMCVLESTSTGNFAHIMLEPSVYMISLIREGNKINLTENSSTKSTNSFNHRIDASANIGEWFNIRIEYYQGSSESVRIKVFFNERCIAVTDNFYYYGSKLTDAVIIPESRYTQASLIMLSSYTTDLLLDNVVADQNYKSYFVETDPEIERNIDHPTTNRITHTFENTASGILPSGFTASNENDASVAEIADAGKQLRIGSGGVKLGIPMNCRGPLAKSGVLDFAMTVDANSEVGAKYEISFNSYITGVGIAAVQLIVSEDSAGKYVALAESVAGVVGTTYPDARIPLGEQVHVRLQYFYDDKVMLISIGESIVKLNQCLLNGSKKYCMAEASISNLTAKKTSALLIDDLVCERVRADYSAVTAPTIDRETHVFDTLDSLEHSGVNVVDGMISFEGAKNGAYVTIPVNHRSSVASFGYASLGITNLNSSASLLVIRFNDDERGTIAAFALEPTGEEVLIYEYTENGKYKTPICRVASSEFTLEIEYSVAKESFNLLVNGNYAASSSVSYIFGGDARSFDTLTVSAMGNAPFCIDNVIAETLATIFKTPTSSTANGDNNSEVMTYETSSFASIPNRINLSLGSPASVIRVRESTVSGAVTRVLEINSSIDSAANDYVTFLMTKSKANYNAVAFETDMMLNPTSDIMTFEIEPQSTEKRAYFISLKAHKNGSKIQLKGTGSDFSEELDVCAGEWFKFRLEYTKTKYDFNYDGTNDILVRVYINGDLIAEGYTPYYKDIVIDASSVARVRTCINAKFSGQIYLDNTCFEQFVMAYDAPPPADTDVLTYEPGVITNQLTPIINSSSGTVKIVDMTIESQVSKVLKFTTVSGGVDQLKISPTVTLDGANAVMYETDIMVEPKATPATLYLEPVTAGGNPAIRLILTAKSDGTLTLSSNDIEERVIGRCGEWLHIKVEFMNPRIDYNGDNRADLLYRVYVGNTDTPLATGYSPNSKGEYYYPSQITHFRLYTLKETSADIYLDDTMIWQVNLTSDASPTPEVEEELPPGHEDDSQLVDPNGWA